MAAKTKNILVLVEHAGQGGAEKVAATVARLLAARSDFKVHFCALYQPAQMPQIPGVEVHTLGLQMGAGMKARIARYRQAISGLRRLKKEKNIGLTLSSLWPVDWLNRLTGRDRKVAIIQINILNNPQNAMMVKMKKLVSFVYRGFDKIVLGGGNLEAELRDFFGIPAEKLQVIHNPVDNRGTQQLAIQLPAPPLEKLFAAKRVLMCANRLSSIKNTEALLRICKKLNDPDVKFLIVGEGEEKPLLQRTAKELGLSFCDIQSASDDFKEHVLFADFQANLPALLSRATLFLFPTKGEGLPLVLLDAMSSGCPALVSDCPNGGISEIMQSAKPYDPQRLRTIPEKATGGYLMPIPDDLETDTIWAEQIRKLLDAPAERTALAKSGKARAEDFDVENIRQQWYTLADSLFNI